MANNYATADIRNIAFIGHLGSGKTLLTENILLKSKVIHKLGEIERGTTVSDYQDDEIKQQFSIYSSLSMCEWNNKKVNILDTPGSGDLIGEVLSALRVVECAAVLVDAEFGIEIETGKLWNTAEDKKIPRIIVISKMDKETVNYDDVIASIKSEFTNPPPVSIQLPIIDNKKVTGIIDIIDKKAYMAGSDSPVDIPADYNDQVSTAFEELAEKVCEVDDALMEKYLGGEPLTEDEVKAALKKALFEYKVTPILCSASKSDIGISRLLDTIVDYCPDPTYRAETQGENPDNKSEETRKMDEGEPFAAEVFKTSIDQYAGRFSYFKICSGSISQNDEIINSRTSDKVKLAHLYSLVGKKQVELTKMSAGDIGVVAKLGETKTNDTLCDPDKPFASAPYVYPKPIYFTAIKPTKNEENTLDLLNRKKDEDPTFQMEFDAETKETVIKGMGELQIKLILNKILGQTKGEVEQSVPSVAYRETIRKKAGAQYRHKKQTGGHGQFAQVDIEIEPLGRNGGFKFVNNIVGGAIPKNYIPAVEKGIQEAMEHGPLAKYPVMDLSVRLFDGQFHDVDSSEMAFKIAGSQAMKLAMAEGNPVMLEPIMNVKIFIPEDMTGAVMNDLSGKRGKVLGMDKISAVTQQINAEVPLSEMMTYCIDLKATTSGKGTFEMEMAYYKELADQMADKVIKARAEKES